MIKLWDQCLEKIHERATKYRKMFGEYTSIIGVCIKLTGIIDKSVCPQPVY